MANSSVIISEELCLGCGYCVEFCPKEALKISGESYSSQGLPLTELTDPESCNACGLCVSMCPHFAIEVFKIS